MSVIQCLDQVTREWLSQVLGEPVESFEATSSESTWAKNAAIQATLADGSRLALWLKWCVGDTFGPSEVDYYTRDYLDLPDAPLVRCYDAQYEAGVGYHVLLEDLSADHEDRKLAPASLEHGLALAESLAKLHRFYWESAPPPSDEAWARYFDHHRPAISAFEAETGRMVGAWFEDHAARLVERWSQPHGLTLLHGDPNPTNVLTPKGAESPALLLDRQPFSWSLTYGLAAFDLAYAIALWWPHDIRVSLEMKILRHWHEALGRPNYSWEQTRADWDLSVEQCLHIPIEWFRNPADVEDKRWLWEWELRNLTG